MVAMHSLLKRQLKRYFGESFTIPEAWQPFVNAVNEAYRQFDIDRGMLERSLELSSEELLEANSELRAVFQANPDLMLRLDREGTILDYTAGSTSDFLLQAQQLLGKRIQDLPIEAAAFDFNEAVGQVLRTQSMVSLEYCLTDRHQRHWFEARLLPLLGNQIIVIIRNITQRKVAEEALRESERRLESIIQGSPIPTFVIGKDHQVIYWNKALEELTRLKAAEMVGSGRHWSAFYSAERPCLADLLVDGDLAAIDRWYAGKHRGSGLIDEAIEIADFFPDLGEEGKWLHCTAVVIRDSQHSLVGAISTIEDVTDRKLAEEKYRSIFENALDGIFQTTPTGRIINANPAFARILRYHSPEELCGSFSDITHELYVHPERRRELLDLVEKQGLVRDFEVEYFRKDQNVVWVNLNMRAVRNSMGEMLYLEGSAQDITERKVLEARLLQVQKMETIGTLAGGIAHDFNNILAAIVGYTEIAKSRLRQKELSTYLDRVLDASERARDLVGQILTFSRSAAQELRPIDLASVTQEALGLLRATIPSTIIIHHRIASELNAVLADPTQIHQVLINLCTNSAQAMREKGGMIQVTIENVELSPGMAAGMGGLRPGPYLKLTVSDTGTGIEPELVHRLFDPFFTTKQPGEGTGLGLSVVYGIVCGYGGTITVQTRPGAGTTFSVYLPAIEEIAQPEVKPTQPLPHGSERVLFVDDEPVLAEMGREMLESLGYRVMATTDSTQAIRIFRADPDSFDLVITDMTMPGMTGVDLSRKILKIKPNIPIILCTGYSELITEEKAKAIGIQGFALKPLNFRSITELICQVLNHVGSSLAT